MLIERLSEKAPARRHPPSPTNLWHDTGANRCDAPSWPPIIRVVWAGGVASLTVLAAALTLGDTARPVWAVATAVWSLLPPGLYGGGLLFYAWMLAAPTLAIMLLLGMLLVGRSPRAAARRRAIVADGSIWTWLVLTLGPTLLLTPTIGMITLAAAGWWTWRARRASPPEAAGGLPGRKNSLPGRS